MKPLLKFFVATLFIYPLANADNLAEVGDLSATPQNSGLVEVTWSARLGQYEALFYSVEFSTDLNCWYEVKSPEISFDGKKALWVDDGTITGWKDSGQRTVFYRVYEKLPIDLSRIVDRHNNSNPIPQEVIYSRIYEQYQADQETIERSRERRDLSAKQGLTHVLGEYIVRLEDIYPYQISRLNDNSKQLVTAGGEAHQKISARLVKMNRGELTHVFTIIEGFAAYLPPEGVDALQKNPLVKSVSANGFGTWAGDGFRSE